LLKKIREKKAVAVRMIGGEEEYRNLGALFIFTSE